ncbi:unnamed protein product [Rhodiola kirilowii]
MRMHGLLESLLKSSQKLNRKCLLNYQTWLDLLVTKIWRFWQLPFSRKGWGMEIGGSRWQ